MDSDDEDEQIENIFHAAGGSEPTLKQANSGVIKREKVVQKPQTQRSAIMGGTNSPMKKKESYGFFESEKAESVVDEVDL